MSTQTASTTISTTFVDMTHVPFYDYVHCETCTASAALSPQSHGTLS
jgi:hypothetical protein